MIVNNPFNSVGINMNKLKPINLNPVSEKGEIEEELSVYEEEDYFFRNPRFKRSIVDEKIKIDSPPPDQNEQTSPFFLTLASSMSMAASSSMSLYTAIDRLNQGASMKDIMPALLIAFVTLLCSFLAPTITRIWTKNEQIKKEKLRQEKYTKYINERDQTIKDHIAEQKFILVENNLPNNECYDIVVNRKSNLWERKVEHDDFLNVRVGNGTIEAKIEVEYEKEKFSLVDDNLKNKLIEVAGSKKLLEDTPVSFSLTEKNIVAIVGDIKLSYRFLDTLLLQCLAFHSYEDIKFVVLTKEENASYYEYLSLTPFVWNNSKTFRFIGSNKEEINQISMYLLEEYTIRRYKDKENNREKNNLDYHSFEPYYVIITDNYKNLRSVEIFDKVLKEKDNLGFSIIALDRSLRRLPSEAKVYLNLGSDISVMVEPNLTTGVKQEFKADFNNLNMNLLTTKLSNVPIEFQKGRFKLPNSYSFLEMYNVGRIEQLNILGRWKDSNPIQSLAAPVGIGENGDLIVLDVHEKVHGPHGLIAGMTGSGKSEFIISFILSLAVNFHPNEVSFVLIDYKGGGLAGAFENKDTGVKIPHIAGTITNLDKTEINRALASLNSELRRRQSVFNAARDKLNESTIDIYKYQRLYRSGQVDEPMSHLVIISDEFAELKMQQPEFMDELMSIARIGRSLGVHLILATQKPSGVVNDQIWSNSRFKVCLKVQDRSDSMDMLKTPVAASITNIGAFYLQVGFNEYFYYGQSAYSGASYYPSDFRIKKIDTSMDFVNNFGAIYKTIDNKKERKVVASGEEITNIVKYLDDVAYKENISIKGLWLNRIPDFIKIDALKNKYNYKKDLYINPVIGEYDDPVNQQQHLLTLPISRDGNTIIYGISGSGKELVLTTLVYSSVTTYTPSEVIFYIMDFSAETMFNLKDIPHVGDVILSGDKEKLENLFKLLNSHMVERKKLFMDYAGSINEYKKATGKDVPSIIIVLNGFDAFNELYPDYSDLLVQYTRECPKFGIYFAMSTNGVNSIRYKLAQNFKTALVLELNDKSDYYSVLGRTELVPSKAVGRGLMKINGGIHEFQTAHPSRKEESSTFFKNLADELKAKYGTKALRIPVLPEQVTLEVVEDKITDLNNVPIGIRKVDLGTQFFNFKKNTISKVVANDTENAIPFIKELLKVFNSMPKFKTYLLDVNNSISINYSNVTKYTSSLDDIITNLNTNIDNIYEEYQTNNNDISIVNKYQSMLFVIFDATSFKNKLADNTNTILGNILEKGSKMGLVNFVVVDTIDGVKKLDLAAWFKTYNDLEQAIWIGEGISGQYTLKLLNSNDRSLQASIPNNFGYAIINGKHSLIKVLYNEIEETNNNETSDDSPREDDNDLEDSDNIDVEEL